MNYQHDAGRVPFRALKREFELDDETPAELVEELGCPPVLGARQPLRADEGTSPSANSSRVVHFMLIVGGIVVFVTR